MDVLNAKHIHFVGIKGVAMAALALYCKQKGIKVTGSDVADEFPTDQELKNAKIPVLVGFDPQNISDKFAPDVVIYTGAHGGRENPIVVAALATNIPVFAHGQALGIFMEEQRQIVVAGSHGKTTTSAMIATILTHAGTHPSYAIGCGSINTTMVAGRYGKGDWFIAEGDEYVTDRGHDDTPRFLWTAPEILVVTNIDFDHPDAYANLEAVQDAFVKLTQKQRGMKLAIVNVDDAPSNCLLGHNPLVTYGFSPRADVRIERVSASAGRMFFTLTRGGVELGEFALAVPGRHNVLNATAAILASEATGLGLDTVKEGLVTFTGTKRRFEKIGEHGNIEYYDDYAHHPHEIEATLAAAKSWFPKRRIIAVFQPHTYSRTKALLPEFSRAFRDASCVLLADIYASAREHDTLGITGASLVEETSKNHSQVFWTKDEDAILQKLSVITKPNDVVLFMGAGDIALWGKSIVSKLTK
jgi:UDP-N-acetylmuramate--alanine ligase